MSVEDRGGRSVGSEGVGLVEGGRGVGVGEDRLVDDGVGVARVVDDGVGLLVDDGVGVLLDDGVGVGIVLAEMVAVGVGLEFPVDDGLGVGVHVTLDDGVGGVGAICDVGAGGVRIVDGRDVDAPDDGPGGDGLLEGLGGMCVEFHDGMERLGKGILSVGL